VALAASFYSSCQPIVMQVTGQTAFGALDNGGHVSVFISAGYSRTGTGRRTRLNLANWVLEINSTKLPLGSLPDQGETATK
jgi:hypothetical protein